MLFKTVASLLAITVPSFATAAEDIDILGTSPVYGLTVGSGGPFSIDVRVAIKEAPLAEGDVGVADFNIAVRVSGWEEEVRATCENEEFLLENSALLFDAYQDDPENCTRRFVAAMNAQFKANIVSSPITLRMGKQKNGESKITFVFSGDMQVDLPRI